ncbi:MAG: DUF885 domain-containing protein [Candidatus Eremiobacteraeota bacterium]|nr:DUF885 domain-containing protein [Candidatus Eremiobacteraeota bacterium]
MNARSMLSSALGVGVVACICSSPGAGSQLASKSAALQMLAHRYYAATWQADPVSTTDLGLHTADDRLADFSPAFRASYARRLRTFALELAALAPPADAVHDRIDYLLLRADMEGDWWRSARLKPLQRNPSVYEQECTNGIFSLLKKSFASNDVRAADAAARMRDCRRVLSQGRANLSDPVREFGKVASEDIAGSGPLFTRSLEGLTGGLSAARKQELYAARDDAQSALQDYKRWVDERSPSWRSGGFAVGKAEYDWYLRRVLLLPWKSDDLLELSRYELARDRGLEAWENDHARFETGPRRAQRSFADKAAFLHFYETQTALVERFLRSHQIVSVPPYLGRFRIVELPKALAATNPGGFMNPPGVFDKDLSGFYFVPDYDPSNTSFFAAQARQTVLPVLAHEGIPGHFMQLSIANHNADFIRRMHGDGVFIEGWAFYGEEMLMRAGLYDDDPAARQAVIHLMRHRATRIMVDVALASGTMSLTQAIAMFAKNAGIDAATAYGEGTRFAMGPGQAIDYLVGKTQIEALLGQVRDAQGGAFRLNAFHDKLLTFGSIPLSAIAWEWLGDRRWIDTVSEPLAPAMR